MASKVNVDKIARASGTPEFTIPTADGTAGQAIVTNASGVLSFADAGATVTGSTATWIPTITGANALTGTANFTYDGNVLDVKNSGTASTLKLYCESSNAHYQAIKAAPHSGSSDWTLTLPPTVPSVSGQALTATTAGVASWATVAGGKVLQLLTVVKQDTFTTNTTSWVDITDLTLTITPSATTSKIYVTAMLNMGQHAGTGYIYTQLMRDSTAICVPTSYSSRAPTLFGTGQPADHTLITGTVAFVDSPSTTSATVYKLQMRSQNSNSQYINRSYTDTDNDNHPRSASTLTVMEIGA